MMRLTVLLAPMLAIFAAGQALSAPAVTFWPAIGHPKIAVTVKGTGFVPGEAIDVYFDTTDTQLVFADASGNFAARRLKVPSDALPGAHWISAVGRANGDGSQKPFTVHTDWAQLDFDERGKRSNPYENVLDTHSARSLDQLWRVPLGAPVNGGSPAISRGLVYIATTDGKLHAIVASTGVEKWAAATGDYFSFATPSIVNGVVYIGSFRGTLYAFDAATGAAKWTAVPGGTMFWSPTFANGILYFGNQNGTFYAYDAQTGAAVWAVKLPNNDVPFSVPVVADGVVYVGTYGSVYAFDAVTGAVKWNKAISNGYVTESVAVANGTIYAVGGDQALFALDATAGGVIWQSAATQALFLALSNGVLYTTTDTGTLEAYDASTGGELWTATLGNHLYTAPAVANGVVYLGSPSGRVFGVDAATGAKIWSANDRDTAGSSPAIADGVVYIGSTNGNLYAYAIEGGRSAVYHRSGTPPSYSALHPDFSLRASR